MKYSRFTLSILFHTSFILLNVVSELVSVICLLEAQVGRFLFRSKRDLLPGWHMLSKIGLAWSWIFKYNRRRFTSLREVFTTRINRLCWLISDTSVSPQWRVIRLVAFFPSSFKMKQIFMNLCLNIGGLCHNYDFLHTSSCEITLPRGTATINRFVYCRSFEPLKNSVVFEFLLFSLMTSILNNLNKCC